MGGTGLFFGGDRKQSCGIDGWITSGRRSQPRPARDGNAAAGRRGLYQLRRGYYLEKKPPSDFRLLCGTGCGTRRNRPQSIHQIHMHFVVKGKDIKPEMVEKAIKLSAEKYCSASIMLGQTAVITHDFEVIQE